MDGSHASKDIKLKGLLHFHATRFSGQSSMTTRKKASSRVVLF